MPKSELILTDGQLDFSGGVDSISVPTIQSVRNPNGLKRSQLAWLDGGTVRDGGILPRGGFSRLGVIHDKTGLFQGQFMYEPIGADPYLIVCISGHVYQVIPGTPPTITDLSQKFGQFMPASQTHFYFVQGEEFLIIQAGDFVTLPLFWDGTTLRRSIGITSTAVPPGTPGVNEIPAAGPMVYYMDRIWYAQGRQYSAGDIVGGPSGTLAYNFRNSILNVTENPLVLGGDGFTVPTNAGNIRALFFNGQLNQQLGQGQLLIGTRKAVYALQVPVTRTDWIAATSNNQPLQTVVQLVNGPVGDRSVVQANGDVFYQSLEPSIRSLFASIRYFNQWGNVEISAQENRVLQFNDRSLLSFSTGMVFNNRLLMSALPKQVAQGVIHQALVPLDFIPISTLGPNEQPVWEGMYESLNYLQLNNGDFGGLERGFATVVSGFDGGIELWELSYVNPFDSNRFDPESRIDWYFETPAFTWGDEFQMKELLSAELWVDRIFGTTLFQMDYRPDGQTCWLPWTKWQLCSAKNSCEDSLNPICYPIEEFGEGNRQTFTLPKPPDQCQTQNRRPSNQGYQFQFRLSLKGFCRVRGLMFKAVARDQALYQNLVCESDFGCLTPIQKLQ